MLSIFALDILLLFALLLIGTPLPYCFGAALIFMVIFAGIPINSLMLWGFNQMIGPVLLAGPLFILVGSVIAESGIAPRLLNAINLLIGKVKGAIGVLVIVACGLLGAISGSSFTGIAAVGPIMIPQMMAQGFSRGYATSLVSVSSILGVLIPPSVPLIIYGWVTGTSVLGSFLSTVGPGILVMILFSIINIVYSRKTLGTYEETASALEPKVEMDPAEKKKNLKVIIGAIPGFLMPIIILGGIYGGVFTPTEAAAVAGVFALFIGIAVYREMGRVKLYKVFKESSSSIGAIMAMILFCLLLAQTYVQLRIPQQLIEIFMGITESKVVILILISIFLFFVGMIVNDTTAIILCAPLLLPLVVSYGIDPIHFASIMCVNLAMGGVTPPYASVLYFGMRVGKANFSEVLKPTFMFILLGYLPVLLLTVFWEPLSMFLPRLFGY
ncbi:TRAP transporter large permease [Cytobacillus firmus]|uniref:TRAP transporter large permease n=1 Tax=Cytobacillus firmus TaxID=1399 RepID=UPI0018CFD3C6|nr:TRAP transporter large permease [Cytobacillus firmus]MBG9444403.1 C4-dicarboxylate ABC transporter permease [Cytobacillus firmus]